MPPPVPARRQGIIYGRLSASAEGIGVDNQIAEGRRIAERDGIDVIAVYRDDGISASRYAKSKDRAGWRQVMEAIDTSLRRGDVLIVREISRASRDRTVSAALLAACTDNGVWLNVGGKLHDPTDPDDSFLLDLTSALAVRESATTSRRVRLASDARAGRGTAHGRLAYGYTAVYDQHTGRPAGRVPDPETAPIVREIADRVLAGEPLQRIADDLNARLVPSPLTITRRRNWRPTVDTPWRPQHIRRIARSETAAGLRLHNGVVRPDVNTTWEPLITPSEHARILELSRQRAEKGRAPSNQPRHLLTHIATCGVCGAELLARRNNTTPSYTCPVGHVSRSRDQLDRRITQVVVAKLLDPALAAALHAGDAAERQSMAEARAQAQTLRTELEGWYEAAAAGTITPAGLGRVERGLLERIEAADAKARPRHPIDSSSVIAGLIDGDVRALWAEASVAMRRQAIRELTEAIRVHRTKRGRRILDVNTVEVHWRF